MELRRFDAATSPIREWLAQDEPGKKFLGSYLADAWEPLVDFETRFVWLAVEGGGDVGFFDLELDPSGAAYFAFYVAPAHRGRGLASQILALGLAAPEAQGRAYLEAGVEPDNVASRRILESAGFRNTGPDEEGMLMYRRG